MEDAPIERLEAHEDASIIRPRLKLTRNRAPRLKPTDLPLAPRVKLPWGLELSLLNISSSGMLVETSSKFTPGSVAEFELRTADDTVVVSGRFVRSEIAEVDGRGVKYHAAAVFEKELALEAPAESESAKASTPEDLADWLRALAAELSRGASPSVLRERIAAGLSAMVSAKHVQLREAASAADEGYDSVCFRVPERSRPEGVLQVTFEQGHGPSDADFRLLQAGAALAAVILQTEPFGTKGGSGTY